MIKQDPKMASETIPPPPPPPLLNNDNTNANGPTTNQVQSSGNAEPSTSTNGAKSWERAWTVDEMRKGATNWSLASDAGLLLYMQEFSQNMLSQTHSMEQKVDGLVHETKGISAKVHNTFNDFLMLSNTQFIENRVYDEEETKDEEENHKETVAQEKEKTREELETEVIPKINEAIQCGLEVLDNAFVTVEITPEQVSDDEDEGTIPENLKPDPILELTDVYAHRKLPSFIGSAEFQKDDLVGLGESSSEDEGSDKEASVESETEKSTEDEDSSETETVSGSPSESEEESSTATESEDEKEVVVKKKARKESSQAESDDELFAAGGTVKSTKSKEAEADDSDESMEDDDEKEEQPRKVGVPMDFSSELAAKLGVKPKKPVDDSDEEADNEDDWGESERRESKSSKDDLFSASVDTAASVSSKGSRRKDKKHKKPKSRSGSHASHDSGTTAAVAAGNVSNELERHDEDGDDQDNLFTSSIDTTSSVVSKGGKSKHRHKNKASRSDSQVSNSSSKSGHKEKKAASNKNENNLFSGSPEGDLFDESSPFAKKGGMFSGGGGLFDDVMEDDDDDTPPKPETLDNDVSKTSHEQDESDEENVKQKPRTPSGKKLPAGAVAIFGDHGPFGHMPVQTNEHHVAKSSTPEKTESKTSTGGGLFSDEGEDIFTSSQSSSVVSNKPPAAVPAKATKSVDLFGSGDDEGDDDDSLFGTKAPKKIEQKAETPKKKLPAGAVSIFGSGSPPPLFSASNTENTQTSPAAGKAANAKAAKETSGLFDEDDDKTSSFNSERSSVPSIAPKVQTKRKTNQISLFDDNDDDDFGDGNDLFSSIAPSKTLKSTTNKTISTHEPARDGKATDVSKPVSKRSTISLFDDDEDEDDDDEDIFSIKPSTKSKPPVVKPSTKSSTPTPGLFASEEDPLFSGSKPQAVSDAVDAVDKKTDVKTDKEESSVLDVDGDDLFAKPKTEDTAVSAPEKKEVNENSDDLFDEDSDEKDEVDAVKPGRKILPGAVPMFGGVDIFAGQKPGKATKAKPQDDSLFADDENDLFAAPPKPVPTVAPRTVKPRKPPVAKSTSSSPLEGSKEQASPPISSSDKNTNVGKLQKTLAFNPAAMLPGAARPPKKQDTTTETVVRNKDAIIFNPATMLPGAVPPPRKQENVVEATFDKPASAKTLETSGKDRARVGGKRRPQTRQARKKAAKDSMDDTSLFGSNLAPPTASNERLAGTTGGQPSLFSDSSDLFSSSSYKSSTKDKLKSHTTQSQASKFDPLFIHNSMSSDLPSFEDSVDGISSDSAKDKKGNVSNLQGNKNKADALFNDPLKDDLFSTSTESDSSFLPNSNIGNHVSNEQESAQKSKSVVDKKQKDDLFSLLTESESSIIQKSEVVPQSVPKPDDTKKSSVEKKTIDDLFNQSTESNISQKARRKEKSDIDSLFENKPNDDLFSRSDNDISSKMKPKEDVSAKKTQNVKTDPLFNSKPNDDLLSELTNSIISKKEKPSTAKTTSQTSSVDPLTNDDLFNQPTKSDTLQKSEQKEDFSAQQDETSKGDPLFNNNKPKNDLESNITEQAKPSLSATKSPNQEIDPIFDSKPKDNPFSQSGESNKSSSQKVQVVEDDDDDEDDLFKPNRPLFTPPPLDFDFEVGASGDFTEKISKTVSDDIFNDDDDIFAPKASRKKVSNNKAEEKTKSKKTNDQEETVQEKPKPSDEKNSNDVDDLFAGTGSIFDDLPKKSKEKKKKKATAAKEENIFDDTKGASEGASTSKTTKKTKGKKKGKSQISIFDEDSPSIFDDPLNATLK